MDNQSSIVVKITNKKIDLNLLVGKRFESLDEIVKKLENLGGNKPRVFFSQFDRLPECDFVLDGTFNDTVDFTLFYLKDNNGNFYITETQYDVV